MNFMDFDAYTVRQRNEDLLREAQSRHLEGRLRQNRKVRAGRSRPVFLLAEVLALLGTVPPATTRRPW